MNLCRQTRITQMEGKHVQAQELRAVMNHRVLTGLHKQMH